MSLIIGGLGIIFLLISIYLFFFKGTPGTCQVSDWSSWGTCNNQKQTRTRTIKQPGTGCPPLTDTQDCPENCGYSDWSACDKTCGGGNRTRSVTSGDTKKCTDLQQGCNTQDCTGNCVYSDWSACEKPCGPGIQTRSVTSGDTQQCTDLQQGCNTQDCPENCVYSDWSACDKTCGGGNQTRTVTSGDTQKCTDLQQGCNTQDCCTVSAWSDWGSCTQPCGSGEQTRNRTVSGTNCPATTETKPCNTQACNRYGTLCANCADPINGCTFTEIYYNKQNCNPTTGTCKNVLGADQLGCLPTGMDMNDICQKQYGTASTVSWNGNGWSCSGSSPSMDINAYCFKKFKDVVSDPNKQVLGVKKPCFGVGCVSNSQWLKSDGSKSDIQKFEFNNFEWDCLYPGTKPCLDDCCSGKLECNGAGKLN